MYNFFPSKEQKEKSILWFRSLRDQICDAFESLEDALLGTELKNNSAGRFQKKVWKRQETANLDHDGGGGEMSLMKGRVFEKVGVNISTVYGTFSQEFASKIPGAKNNPHYWASGISLVAHMQSPLVPAVHMNTRHIITEKNWFGGGIDLTPIFSIEEDSEYFHGALKKMCDSHHSDYYPRYKQWCDEYFYLPHRKETRGIGGIFYDNLYNQAETNWEDNFAFTQSVGKSFLETYPEIVKKHFNKSWTEAQREEQLVKRGRYVEFNLLYDRGTTFGLKTGGNVDAILMSLPPVAKWV